MRTNLPIDLTEAQLMQLGQAITGRNKPATRKQITAWASKLLQDALRPHEGPTQLVNVLCPKCARPIGVQVPVAAKKVNHGSG